MKVAILGASGKPDRYAYLAQKLLMEHGYTVYPVSPRGEEILGVSGMTEVPAGVDTVTVYLREERLLPILETLIESAPRRVIFNPGTESGIAAGKLEAAGIETEEGCTLVILSTGGFQTDV